MIYLLHNLHHFLYWKILLHTLPTNFTTQFWLGYYMTMCLWWLCNPLTLLTFWYLPLSFPHWQAGRWTAISYIRELTFQEHIIFVAIRSLLQFPFHSSLISSLYSSLPLCYSSKPIWLYFRWLLWTQKTLPPPSSSSTPDGNTTSFSVSEAPTPAKTS